MDFEREKWMALQDLNPSDVADAICDSQAIVEAIQSNAWADVADMVRSRVELKAERLAQTALEIPLTPWVDSDEELQLWRYYRAELAREAIEHNKPKLPKINPYTSEASNEN
jgi:hypothetical protein